MEKLELKHRSGKILNLEVKKYFSPSNSYIRFRIFDAIAEAAIKDGQKTIKINDYYVKGGTKESIESLFGVKIKSNADLYLVITEESYAEIKKAEADFEIELKVYKDDYDNRAKEMPIWFEMYDFFDWGDYTINSEREIRVFRKPLPEDSVEKVLVISYKLWNMSDEEMAEEWRNDFTGTGGQVGNGSSIVIAEELARKWITKWSEVQDEIHRKHEEEKRIAEEKRLAEEKRRSDCFEEAKRTGKKVVLHSIFLSGDDIPYRFRDDDSDMGHLITYAMPDGTTKDEFSHAY